jgi:3-oxoacyl-[acyl-carrier-protein] synthase-3
MDFGLVSFGTALGVPTAVDTVVDFYTDDIERVIDYGYRTIHRSPPEVGVTSLATDAARRALEAADVDPLDLDLIVLGLTDIAEYLYWDPSASLQHRLGAYNAEAVLIAQACTACLAGLDLIAGKFASHPAYRTALIVGANRTCEAYWNRMATQPLLFSDGAAAAVARRGHPRLRWRASEAMTDGRYADFHLLEVGGTASPFGTAPQAPDSLQVRDAWDIMEYFDYDEEPFREFMDQIGKRARLMAQRACAQISIDLSNVRRLISLHDNKRSFASLAAQFGLPLSATNLETGLDIGHIGAADQIYSLAADVAAARLEPGDLVALVGMGRGMHWACTLIEA